MTHDYPQNLVLSIYAFTRGFAFVLFEGPDNPFDWGVKDIRGQQKNARVLDEITKLIDRYQPEVLVIEDIGVRTTERISRIRKLYHMLARLAESQCIELYRYSKSDIRACFEPVGVTTKYEVAKVIALQMPVFAHRLPRYRKAWMSEDPRQSLFDAAALGIAYYAKYKLLES